MKIKLITLTALSLITNFAWGQYLLYNNGATVKIQSGATLYVEGGVHNTPTGNFDNDGTLEIKGDFLNEGTWEPTTPNTLKFSGNTPSNVTSAPSVNYQDVVVQKDGANVVLLSDMTVNDSLVFSATAAGGKVVLGAFNLNMGAASASGGYDSDEYVVTGGAGSMKKSYSALTNFFFPVGFDATTYNPAELTVTAGPNETYGVRVGASPTDGNGFSGTPLTADAVNAVWEVTEATPGGNTVNLQLSWSESDELAGYDDASNFVSYNNGTTGWDGLFTSLGSEEPTAPTGNKRSRNGVTSFGNFAVGGELLGNALVLNTKVFLQGPYASGQMGDQLRVQGKIPLAQPYSDPPYSVAPFSFTHVGFGGGESVPGVATFDQPLANDDVVDWVIVEIRDATTPATRLATKAALIQRDGHIVDLDGASNLKIYGLADGNYHVRINHRNHLGVRTASALGLSNTVANLDFTVAGFAFDNATGNAPMRDLGSGVMGMWAGDASGDKIVRYTNLASPPFTPSDRNIIFTTLGGNPNGSLSAYNRADLNMDGFVRYTNLASPPFTPSDGNLIFTTLGGNPNGQINQDN